LVKISESSTGQIRTTQTEIRTPDGPAPKAPAKIDVEKVLQQSVEQRTGLADNQQQLANFASHNQQASQVDKNQTGTLELLQQKKQLEHNLGTPQARLNGLLEDNPELKTNQDFINYCYRHGDNNWGGASKVADRYGKDLNDLVQDRSGAIRPNPRPETEAPTTHTPSAPVTNPHATGAQLETFPIAGGRYNIGYDRDWNNFNSSTATHNSDFSRSPTDANHPSGHQGVDIFAPKGQPVVSPVTGLIEHVGRTSVGGNCITIRRGDERFYMAHLDSLQDLRAGQTIHAGDAVGTVGNTGNAQGTAPHVHFSIYRGSGGYYSNPINPFPHLMAAR